MLSLPFKFLIYGPDDTSFATIAHGGGSFGYQIGSTLKEGIEPDRAGVKLTGVKWAGRTQLTLSGITADGKIYLGAYEIETDK